MKVFRGMSKVITVVPTRGLIYAGTISSIHENLLENNLLLSSLIIGSPRPMPDCFNQLVRDALAEDAEFIWFVEEDNEAPPGVLKAMLEEDVPYITLDYHVGKGVSHIQRDARGEIIWTGLGCTLIKAEVFKALQDPWFEVNKRVSLNTGKIEELDENSIKRGYGGHDVLFGRKLRELSIPMSQLKGWFGRHFRALEIPKREINNGQYTITSL